MGGSSSQAPTQTSQATADPWSGVQPALSTLYSNTLGQFTNDVGYHPYGGNLQAPLNSALNTGLASEYNLGIANQYGTPGVNDARALGDSLLKSGGLNAGQQGVAANYGQVFAQNAGEQNPYLLGTIAAQNRQIADKVNSSMSGAGRYGSGAHTDVLGRSLAEAADPILAQDYAQRQQTSLAALQGQGNIYNQGQDTAGKWAQLMPALDEAQYAPAYHMQNYGKFFQDRAQQDVANQVATWNAQEARTWEQAARLANILSGAGGLGGTKVTTQNAYQPTTLQKIGGGAIAGAGLGSMFGPVGAGVGAAGGGLLGLL